MYYVRYELEEFWTTFSNGTVELWYDHLLDEYIWDTYDRYDNLIRTEYEFGNLGAVD